MIFIIIMAKANTLYPILEARQSKIMLAFSKSKPKVYFKIFCIFFLLLLRKSRLQKLQNISADLFLVIVNPLA